jgi:high frequency lysogenization protein
VPLASREASLAGAAVHWIGGAAALAGDRPPARAALLAALRSAVLWRQLDGTLWDFLLRKQAIRSGIDALLA